MTELLIHPGLVLIVGAFALPWLRGTLRSAAALALPLLALALVWQLPDGRLWQLQFLDHTLTPLQGDKLSRLFAAIFALMAAGGALFALRQPSRVELPAAFVYAGSAIGVALAGDLLTLFVYWEVMAVASTLVLWSAANSTSYRASLRYLMIHLLGGVILFAGITGHVADTGSVEFTRLALDSPAQVLILAGFLVNAAAPPLSAWLSDAYPEASWSGTVFLSAFTTKAAVYALIRGFAGTEWLVWIGLFMVFYGIVYGLLENDLRRILAYSLVNQVGFMIVGVGIGSEMALNGAVAQAVTGIVYQALLFMAGGAVLLMAQRRRCSELGGLARSMPVTAACACIGALAIAAAPFTVGFVSKSMVFQAALDQHLQAVWLLLTAGSAGVVLHAGLKFPWLVFFDRDSGLRSADPPASLRWAMVAFAVLCIVPGIWYQPLYRLLPYPTDYAPYTAAHVLTQLQLLLFAGLAYFVLRRWVGPSTAITLDSDWLWRRGLPALLRPLRRALMATQAATGQLVGSVASRLLSLVLRHHGPQGRIARTWPTGSMALWVLVLLLGYLLLYYL